MIELELPWCPSVNHYKRVGRTIRTANGKSYQQRVNTNDTKLFYYQVWSKVRSGLAAKTISVPLPLTIPIKLWVTLHPPDKKRRDIDNNIKIIFDSLMHSGLIKDDSQIHLLTVEKKSIIPEGKVIVRIEELICT